MTINIEPLMVFRVDNAIIGDKWPGALVHMVECHELRDLDLATRKEVHKLVAAYAAKYFPERTVTHDVRRAILRTLHARLSNRVVRSYEIKTRVINVAPSRPTE